MNYTFPGGSARKGMNPKILKQVDLKLDDGEYWNGRIRSSCYGGANGTGKTTYDEAIDKNKKCAHFIYVL